MAKQLSRGLRNNNPGNIRHSKSKWQGMADVQNDKDFITFTEPKFGIRAIAVVLTNYGEKYGLDSVQEIINRWAPPNENDTRAYIKAVADKLGVGINDTIDLTDPDTMAVLVKAIIQHENGSQPYTDVQIKAGIAAAGVAVPKKPLKQSRTVQGGTVAAATGAVALVGETVKQIEPAMPLLNQLAQYAPWVFGVVVLVAGAYVIWSRYDDRKSGMHNG